MDHPGGPVEVVDRGECGGDGSWLPPQSPGRAGRVGLMTSLNSAIRSPFQQPEPNFFRADRELPVNGRDGCEAGLLCPACGKSWLTSSSRHRPDQSECL